MGAGRTETERTDRQMKQVRLKETLRIQTERGCDIHETVARLVLG